MLTGTIQDIQGHGSITALVVKTPEGTEHTVYGDTRPMHGFLDQVLAHAQEENESLSHVLVAFSGPGLAEWMAIANDVAAVA